MDNNGVVQLCLKKRLNFKSYLLFEAVRPKVVHSVLDFKKKKKTHFIITLILTLTIYLKTGPVQKKLLKIKIFQIVIFKRQK